jgi:hypothetical protein
LWEVVVVEEEEEEDTGFRRCSSSSIRQTSPPPRLLQSILVDIKNAFPRDANDPVAKLDNPPMVTDLRLMRTPLLLPIQMVRILLPSLPHACMVFLTTLLVLIGKIHIPSKVMAVCNEEHSQSGKECGFHHNEAFG